MGRLLDWPRGVGFKKVEPLSGPRTLGSGSSESMTGYVQTFASPFGLWRFRFHLPPLATRAARAVSSLLTALHGGANAVRVPFVEPYPLSWREMGYAAGPDFYTRINVPWSNGQPWSNGAFWEAGRPTESVTAAAVKGATTVQISTALWGGLENIGVFIGFGPQHFGLYKITQVISPGRVRIWPPLRKAVGVGSYVTLDPVVVMRLEGEAGAGMSFERIANEGTSLVMVEVEDSIVRRHFTG